MTDPQSRKLRSIAYRNTQSTMVAYAVPTFLYSGLASGLGLTSTPFWVFIVMYAITVAFISLNLIAIRLTPKFSFETGAPVLFTQVGYFILIFALWIVLLEKARSGGLFFALSMLVYTFAYNTQRVAITINTLTVTAYLSACFYAIQIQGQSGSLLHEIMIVIAYLSVSIVVGRVGAKLANRKRKVKALLSDQKKTQKELKQALENLKLAASTDELTGLLNRREINNRLKYEHQQLQRNQGVMSVMILDIDHFKLINDRHGHPAGDSVLKAVADFLKEEFRTSDSVSRWGGEEFIILMPDTDLKQAFTVCERVIARLAELSIQHESLTIQVTASGGISEIHPRDRIEVALHEADEFLYKAKRNGRNQVLCAA